MKIDTTYPVTVPVRLNGAGPFTFVLDTGCVHVDVSQPVADELSLTADEMDRVVLDTFCAGDLVLPDYQLFVRDNADSRLVPDFLPRVDGHVGMGLLRYYETEIDYAAGRLELTDVGRWVGRAARSPEPGFSYVRIQYAGRYVVVPTHVNGRGPFAFLLDSGARSTILSPELVAELGLTCGEDHEQAGAPAAVPTEPRHVDAVSLAVGDRRVDGLSLPVVDCSLPNRDTQMEIRGYLGHNFLEHFAVRFNVVELWLAVGRCS